MADFHQEGVITTLHALHEIFNRDEYVTSLERRLEDHARHVRIALLLPSLYSETQNPEVLDRIMEEIQKVKKSFSFTIRSRGLPATLATARSATQPT